MSILICTINLKNCPVQIPKYAMPLGKVYLQSKAENNKETSMRLIR